MEQALRNQSNDDNPVVLVIDDDLDVREGLRELLESVSLQSRTFGSPQEFLRDQIPDQAC
jgi:FixJ family two-component response regulator